MSDADILCVLPCGVTYIPLSVSGAQEKNIEEKNQPLFHLPSIKPSERLTIRCKVRLDCTSLSCLDNQVLFLIKVLLKFSNIIKEFISQALIVESPNLLISAISKTYAEVPSFSTFSRTVTIKNTRTGASGSFLFRHDHDPYITTTLDKGHIIDQNLKSTLVQLDSADFKRIGNKDGFFDFNESIELTETIVVTACSYDHQFVKSDYTLYWGCNNEVCSQHKAIANIRILNHIDAGPKMTFRTNSKVPDCYANNLAEQSVEVRIQPHRTALVDNVFVIKQLDENRGILLNSIKYPLADQILYHDIYTNNCGLDVAKSASIFTHKFDASSSLTISNAVWFSAFCETSDCKTKKNSWNFKYEYRKECSDMTDTYFSGDLNSVSSAQNALSAVMNFYDVNKNLIPLAPKPEFADGFKGFVRLAFEDNRFINNNNGLFNVALQLPKGFSMAAGQFILGGKAPSKINISDTKANNIINLTYQLPFDRSSVFMDIPFDFFCDKIVLPDDCNFKFSSCNCGLTLVDNVFCKATLQLDEKCPDNGSPVVCSAISYASSCKNFTCFTDTIPAAYSYEATLQRTNFGKADHDGDGIADDVQISNPELYKRHYMMPGDSFKIEFSGVIVSDKPGATFKNLVVRIGQNLFLSNDSITSDFYRSLLIGPNTAIQTYRKEIRIRQKKSNKVFLFSDFDEIWNKGSIFLFLSADSLNKKNEFNPLPSDFIFSDGDSVSVNMYRYIDLTLYKMNKANVKRGHFFQFTYSFHTYTGDDLPDATFSPSPCDCYYPTVLFPTFQMSSLPQQTSILLNKVEVCPQEFYESNIFDFSLGHQELDVKNQPIFPFEIRESAKPVSLVFSGFNNIEFGKLTIKYLNKFFVSNPKTQGQMVKYDFIEILPPASKYTASDFAHIMKFFIEIKPAKCVNLTSDITLNATLYFKSNEIGALYFPDSLTAKFQFYFPPTFLNSFIFEREVTAFSNQFKIPIALSGIKDGKKIENIFMKVTNALGKITSLKIRDVASGIMYESGKDIFQLGTLVSDIVRQFEITGIANSCGSEKICIEYGYNCEPYTDIAFQPCYLKKDSVIVNFPEGLIDLSILSGDFDSIKLCDTIIQKIHVFNAGLGNIYDLNIKLNIPTGLKIIDGLSKIYYPAGQTDISFKIADPVITTNKVYEWAVKDVWPLHQQYGLNGAGSYPANGFDLEFATITDCGFNSGLGVSYTLASLKACGADGNKLTRSGKPIKIQGIDPSESIQVLAGFQLTEQCGEQSGIVNIRFNKPKSPDSYLAVRLPLEWTILSGSLSGNFNQQPVLQPEGIYFWPLINALSETEISFSIINTGTNYCMSDIIEIFITEPTLARCLATGESCAIGSVLGQTTVPVIILRSEYLPLHFEVEVTGTITRIYTEIERINGSGNEPISGLIFIDANQNTLFDSNEKVLAKVTLQSSGTSDHKYGQWTVISDSIAENQLCQLVFFVPRSENCLCSDLTKKLNKNIKIYQPHQNICDGNSLELGIIKTENSSYQWNENTGLSCTQCPSAVFQYPGEVKKTLNFNKILNIYTENGCSTAIYYPLTVIPIPEVLTKNLTLCAGDTLIAITTPGSTYVWEGPGILQNGMQQMIAVPQNNAVYTCTVSDLSGCSGTGSFEVRVLPLPYHFILSDSLFCPDTTAQINVVAGNSDFFRWTVGASRLENPLSLLSGFKTFENFIFNLELRNGSCKQDVSIPVEFYKIRRGIDQVEVCIGESYQFFEMILKDEGTYCVKISHNTDCDSIYCVQLKFKKPPDLNQITDVMIKEKNKTLTLSAPAGFSAYAWTPSAGLSCSDCRVTLCTAMETTNYIIKVTDELGCSAEKNILITINDVCRIDDIVLPNAFSPNGDGVNDFYTLSNIEFCGTMDIKVFNRWGNIVYEQYPFNNKWNGISDYGGILPQGTYFVQITFDGYNIVKTGMIDLRKN